MHIHRDFTTEIPVKHVPCKPTCCKCRSPCRFASCTLWRTRNGPRVLPRSPWLNSLWISTQLGYLILLYIYIYNHTIYFYHLITWDFDRNTSNNICHMVMTMSGVRCFLGTQEVNQRRLSQAIVCQWPGPNCTTQKPDFLMFMTRIY